MPDTEVDAFRLLNKPKFDYRDIEELVGNEQKENINLEYKSGEWLTKNEEGKRKIRKWVTAFANSAGGLLVLGVPEKKIDDETIIPNSPDGIEKGNLGEHGVAKWIEDCLKDKIVPKLVPFPRIFSFDHPDDSDKVIVVVQIKETTLPLLHRVYEGSDIRYYHRHNFQVLEMDEWEVRALLFGRTRAPLLEMRCLQITPWEFEDSLPRKVKIALEIENKALTITKFVHIGFITPHPISLQIISPRDGYDSPVEQTDIIVDEIKDKFRILEDRSFSVETITYLKRFISPLGTLRMEIRLGIHEIQSDMSSIGIFLVAENMMPKSYLFSFSHMRGKVPYKYPSTSDRIPCKLTTENEVEDALTVYLGTPPEDKEPEYIPPECLPPEG